METPHQNPLYCSQTSSLDYQAEMMDQSLLFKLRRSCQKIEQLMKECEKLRRDSDLKLKIISNLQNKEKENNIAIEDMRTTIDMQNTQIQSLSRRIYLMQLDQQDSSLEKQFKILQMRYANCQQENLILRQVGIQKQDQIKLLQQKNSLLSLQNHILIQQIEQYRFQIEVMSDKIKDLATIKNELEIMKQLSYQKNGQLEMSLAQYRNIVADLSVQANQALREQEQWNNNYNDLAHTVEHIQSLRLEHKLRKLQKTI